VKKILVLTLIALAAWQASVQLPGLFTRRPEHEAVVRNRSGRAIERLRLEIGGRSFVAETLAAGADARFRFSVTDDDAFDVVWRFQGSGYDSQWSGGLAPRGPIVRRHTIAIDREGGVIYTATPMASTARGR
jgi:hypothetical protein